VLAVACAVLAFIVLSGSSGEVSSSVDLILAPPPGANYQLGNNYGGGHISPDGKRIVFLAEGSEGTQLWTRSLERDDARPIPGTRGASYPFWSPDSRSIAYFEQRQPRAVLKRVELGGGLPQTISDLGTYGAGRGGSWRADGTILYGAVAGDLRLIPPGGGDPIPVTTLDAERHETAHYWPQFVGSGERYLYFVRSNRKDLEGIYLGTLGSDGKEAGRTLLVTSSGSGVFVSGESATKGHLIWPREGRLLARPADLAAGVLEGETSDLGIDAAVIDAQRGSLFSVSNDGTLVAVSPLEGADRLIAVDRTGRNLEILWEADDAQIVGPAASPDGRYITFGKVSAGNQDLWMFDRQTARAIPLTFGDEYDEAVRLAWLSDSTEVLLTSWTSGSQKFVPRRVTTAGGLPPVAFQKGLQPAIPLR
jgi:eukaryotic-like serine/threonine-protein kinase